MDPQLLARPTWTALLVLIALSGAGLAVAAVRLAAETSVLSVVVGGETE